MSEIKVLYSAHIIEYCLGMCSSNRQGIIDLKLSNTFKL